MPNPFSESSYALALSCELLGWSRTTQALAAYPVVPTLQQEADLGYDLSLAMNWAVLFLQFKVPQRLHGANAGQMSHFGRPYFRFPVKTNRTANNAIQHNTLLQLEQQRSADALVYYSAPIFAQGIELYDAVITKEVQQRSVFVPPSILPAVRANDRHVIAYTGQHDVTPFSEPGHPRDGSDETFHGQLIESVRERPDRARTRKTAAEYVQELAKNAEGLLPHVTVDTYAEVKRAKSADRVYPGGPSPLEAKIFEPDLYEREYVRDQHWGATESPKSVGRAESRTQKRRVVTPLQAVMELGRRTGTLPFLLSSR